MLRNHVFEINTMLAIVTAMSLTALISFLGRNCCLILVLLMVFGPLTCVGYITANATPRDRDNDKPTPAITYIVMSVSASNYSDN